MSDVTKLYHWTNITLNPTLLVLIFATQSEYAIGIAMGWALISAILNEKIRSWVIGFFASLTAGSLVVIILGSHRRDFHPDLCRHDSRHSGLLRHPGLHLDHFPEGHHRRTARPHLTTSTGPDPTEQQEARRPG